MMIGYSPCLKFGIVGGTFKSVETYGAEMGVDMFPKELFSKSFLRIIIICKIFFVLLPKTAVSLLHYFGELFGCHRSRFLCIFQGMINGLQFLQQTKILIISQINKDDTSSQNFTLTENKLGTLYSSIYS